MTSTAQTPPLRDDPAENPFHGLIDKFSRYKTGSFELLFTIEAVLLRYSGLALLLMFAMVLPRFEEVDYLSTFVRLSTMVYPCFFVWSLTRISGVELMQLVLEGHWTGEVLASTLSNRALKQGFVTPLWTTVRHYALISVFSLALYGMEAHVIIREEGLFRLSIEQIARYTLFYYALFFSVIAWIIFVYMGRLYGEVRLRNGLLKGLATLGLLLGGLALFIGYCVLFYAYGDWITRGRVIAGLAGLTVVFLAAAGWYDWKLTRNFRRYLGGQLGIDLLIHDELDPYGTTWRVIDDGLEQ
ncbi:MAG: hypothetical protein M1457_07495 [bacterium]|nr:hypothetical protein [bacterium]